MNLKLYEVGGKIRDEILGLSSKDVDYSVVLPIEKLSLTPFEGFSYMEEELKKEGYTIFLSTFPCFTIRAKFPTGHEHEGLVADFVLARKEIGYKEGTREPIVELGCLYDDLIRRDFTLNTIAKNESGVIIDLFNGKEDLNNKILKTPLDPYRSLNNDPLRILRGLRFAITKGFKIYPPVLDAMRCPKIQEKLFNVVSIERVREELNKMLAFDTLKTLRMLEKVNLTEGVFSRGLKLTSTLKQ
jgi:tRNA nucleotidyltransferase/poly(A) polymerase